MPNPPTLVDVSCVAHVHSRYSDGTATVAELLAAAAASGRDAVLLTDHDTLAARRDGWEGWHGSVLLIVGLEISPKAGHVLAFGLDEEIDHRGLREDELLAGVAAAGGFAFIAHPFSQGARMSRRIAPPHGWSSLAQGGFAGIELWSLATDIAEAWRSPREALKFLRAPERFVEGPPSRNLQAWDELCLRRRVAALGGLDAHQPGLRLRGRVIGPMPNERYFRLFGTHLLIHEPLRREASPDRAVLLEALREGRSYLALDFVGDPRGFAFWGEAASDVAVPGQERAADGDWTLFARAPAEANLRLIRDGTLVASRTGAELEHRAANAGVYRLEAWRRERGRDRLWIVTNPIHLR